MQKFKKEIFSCAVLLVAFLSGCVSTSTTAVGPNAFMESKQEKVSAARTLLEGNTVELSIEVDGSMEVSFHRAVLNRQGVVTLPLVGDVKVGGLTLDEARTIIGLVYSDYYVNTPVIMISVANDAEVTEWGFVTVLGRVGQPGRVPLTSSAGIKLSGVIQQAGGFSSSAKSNEIRITRMQENGKKIQTTIDFEQIGRHGNVSADITLLDGDIVFVPERIF